jgi:hypothetical protein
MKRSTMIVVDPRPDEAIKNLEISNQECLNRIIPIRGFFGDEEVFNRIEEDTIKVDSKKRYEERSSKRLIDAANLRP